MKILQIHIENYKRISAIRLDLDGANAVIAGEPGQGKTTAVSALFELIKAAGDPIKRGEKDASIRIVLGGDTPGVSVLAERRITEKSSTIAITGSDGQKITAKDFAQWLSDLAVNPHRIMDLKPLERTEALLNAAEFSGAGGTRLKTIDKEIESATQERLSVHRDLERAKQRCGPEPEKSTPVLLADITRALTDAQKINAEIDTNEIRATALDAEIKALETRLATLKNELATRRTFIDGHEHQDTEAIHTELAQAEERNRKAAAHEAWKRQNEEFTKFEKEHRDADQEVKALQDEKKQILESAKWPVPGIEVSDGKILYQSIPLEQCGTSEQMLLCGAIAATAIAKSKIRVVRMDGIESMSKADFAALEKIFEAHDVQVLATRVTRDQVVDDGEILIVDGAIYEQTPF